MPPYVECLTVRFFFAIVRDVVADQLSEVLDLVEVRGQMTSGFTAGGHWLIPRTGVRSPLEFIAMVRGTSRLLTDGLDAPIDLGPGDVAVLNNRTWLWHEGGPADEPPHEIVLDFTQPYARLAAKGTDMAIGGHVDYNEAGRALLASALPPVAHVRGATGVRQVIERLAEEAAGGAGSAFAIRQYGQLLLLGVLRAYLGQADLPPGWLRVLTDERLRPAVSRMHAEPGKPWRLTDLARAAAMSRTSFAERFRQVAGIPPLAYLNAWRMLLAQRALRGTDVRVGPLAAELGYASESAFSTAFKRAVGEAPLRYRARKGPLCLDQLETRPKPESRVSDELIAAK